MPIADEDLTPKDIRDLTAADAVAAFLTRLGYPTGCRKEETPAAYGLTGETADAIRGMELLAEDEDQFFRVLFLRLRSVTAKARNELVKNLGKRSADHLLILTSDFDTLEFVLIDKETRQRRGPGGGPTVHAIPRVVAVQRKSPRVVARRLLRRLTWTGKDSLAQFDKLRSAFQSAHYAERYFVNRALFADHYLTTRLTEDDAWRENPSTAFAGTVELMRDARSRWVGTNEQRLRDELFGPVWKLLGFKAKVNKPATRDHLEPDYILNGPDGQRATVAFVYRWGRWLDGPDLNDPETPDENPGAAVVSALARGDARWVIVTNGKTWRLYSKDAHSRSTNFYEVDLEEALVASEETDPNEAFRYWWLFFRQQAFADTPETEPPTCWLDTVVQGSRDYAKRLGDRLKDRIFLTIFPHLAQGFLHDRRRRLRQTGRPSEAELRDTFEATLTLLYRLLFMLYAEARDLLPVDEPAYQQASLKQIKEEIAAQAGVAESAVPEKLSVYNDTETALYDRLARLFAVMDQGDAQLNVPCYNGGLFISDPAAGDGAAATNGSRERRIAAFLLEHKVPDRFLALAIDRLSRDQDEKTLGLVFIDYKSLEVRHLGSIYEGLLEFKLKIAEEDLGVKTEKKAEKFIPLAEARKKKRSRKVVAEAVVRKGEVYLSNDKAERKATGSYYTPDPIVEYIVEHTVGPVLDEKLEALKPELTKAGRTYRRQLSNAENNPGLVTTGATRAGGTRASGSGVSPVELRAFAAAKTYAEHRALVDQVFDLKVLDPAMGSGHFLVEAVDFITDRLLDFLNRYPNNPIGFMLDKTRRSILDALGEQGVTVDADKLTDVNLLKRHVLKRCIYGVDLNPMAVELAKVSLWLDAFTLGAPLSFLDHHLRCGNSLIGATFEDLKKATGTPEKGTGRQTQLFSLDYEPLLRAINKVLFVNAMADATAAEVHRSQDAYAQARHELSGYRIVLDALVADYFVDGKPRPSSLVREASDLDLTSRDALLASLRPEDHPLLYKTEAAARRADLRFFHWEIEFPEVFWDFADAERRRIEPKNRTADGSAGFDAVVGNPPYVRQESLRPLKPYLSSQFASYASTADLFVYFYDRACQIAKNGGYVSFITSGSWMRASFGAALRRELQIRMGVHSIVDFGEWQPFPGAEMIRPSIVVLQRARPVPRSAVYRFLSRGEPPRDLTAAVQSAPRVGHGAFTKDAWHLDSDQLADILDKLNRTAASLASYVTRPIRRGIITGLTDAFVVDENTFHLLQTHSSASTVLFSYAEGKDLRPWFVTPAARHVIAFPRGWSRSHGAPDSLRAAERWLASAFPSIYEWLLPFRERARRRADKGDYWWELRSCDYWTEFSSPKIVWPDISKLPRFSLDQDGLVLGNTAYFIPSRDYFLLGVLSSWATWFAISRVCQPLRLRGGRWQYRLFSQFMESIPVPRTSDTGRNRIARLADTCNRIGPEIDDIERQGAVRIAKALLGEDTLPRSAQCWWELDVSTLTELGRTRRRPNANAPCIALAIELHADLQRRRNILVTEIENAQAEINEQVAFAFGLTEKERRLIGSTVAS